MKLHELPITTRCIEVDGLSLAIAKGRVYKFVDGKGGRELVELVTRADAKAEIIAGEAQ